MILHYIKKSFFSSEKSKKFLNACEENDIESAKKYLENFTNKKGNENYNDGWMAACGHKDSQLAQFLLNHHIFGTYLIIKFNYKGNLISLKELGYGQACKTGNINLVQYFINEQSHSKVDVRCQNRYALNWICSNGYTDILSIILDEIVLDSQDCSIIEYAVAHEKFQIIDMLVYHGQQDHSLWCQSGIKRAIENEQSEVVEYFFYQFEIIIDEQFKNWLLNDDNYESFSMKNFVQSLFSQYYDSVIYIHND